MNFKLDRLGRNEIHYASNEGDLKKLKDLIAAEVDINFKDKEGWTPLHFACQAGKFSIVSLLIDFGAEVDAVDKHGNTPLFKAVFRYSSDGRIIELLRKRGANPYCQNKYGQTPVGLARLIANTEVAKFFEDLPL